MYSGLPEFTDLNQRSPILNLVNNCFRFVTRFSEDISTTFPCIYRSTLSLSAQTPTDLIMVPQTRYECPTRQDGWESVAPIEFGGIKLTDAANKAYRGLHDYDDHAFNYEGVGRSISCRLNVRRTPQPSQTRRLTFISQFSGKDIGKVKVCPTDHSIVGGLTIVIAGSGQRTTRAFENPSRRSSSLLKSLNLCGVVLRPSRWVQPLPLPVGFGSSLG